jgi:hypothetical protein
MFDVIQIKGLMSITRPVAIVLAAGMSLCPNCLAQTPPGENESVSSKLDGYMSAMTDSGLFMGAVLVAQDGKTLLSRGYGMANLEHEIPDLTPGRLRQYV